MNVVMVAEILNLFLSTTDTVDIPDLLMSMSYIGFVINSSWKIFMIWKKRPLIESLICDLHDIFPTKLMLQQDYDVQVYLRKCHRKSKFMSLLFVFAIWFFNLLAILEFGISSRNFHHSRSQQELPYFMYIPWNWQNHWSYYLLYVMASMAGHTTAMGNVSNDMLLYSLISQLIMHFDFVANTMESYEIESGSKGVAKMEGRENGKDLEFLKCFIEYHSHLLGLSDRLNDIFGLLLFVHFASASFVICLLGFLMTIGTSFLSLFKLSLFLFTMLIQSAEICSYGQMLMDSSLRVSTAVLTTQWLKTEVRCQKMLILMSKRAQRPAQLKATYFIWISQGTMNELLHLSYKFFTLLRTMYVKK
ncbi:odorant receptor 85b-like [Musca domestica]|uniref:Odorant receptor n=1 Tax=Musca domestica TaxID=7370 RepID=A0ABM3UYJ3_MUSDO|nr:odorant receptor 85b-like [Musca domestica]